jgi:riboflavin synthase
MFTGIIETTGKVLEVREEGSNRVFLLNSSLAPELRPDQSLSHNGVCLTVEEVAPPLHRVTAVAETLKKTNLGTWEAGTEVNLERCLVMNGRLDGHLVQGHVDTTGSCLEIREKEGSWEFRFQFDPSFSQLMIEKGSVAVNGISLTAFSVQPGEFTVAIIPYTYQHTNMASLKPGDKVNLEFDMIGKYVRQMMSGQAKND